ncbi:MAG: Arm DNA-binding domain-containing protein [Sphingopyxis granuli]|uniref:Arm DNA-binding domain-containing protein n=1 Tax=unclassified Sphingopyxis TaxID=2614943 RepID=UPI001F28943A|nr:MULTISPECIES: Arm DNA-binding domain-containing protein [unclassified Sphingopyxis]
MEWLHSTEYHHGDGISDGSAVLPMSEMPSWRLPLFRSKRQGPRKAHKLTDGDGLFLYATPNGGRYWRMNYRYLGKQKTLAFGVYPDISLAEAREQRNAARKLLARGSDPAEQIKLERIAAAVAASNSFNAVADE